MVRARAGDGGQLESPLLAPESNRDGEKKYLERERSKVFRSLSGRWNNNVRNGYEDATTAKSEQKARSRRSQKKRSLRNPIKDKSFVRRAAHSAANDPAYFLKNLVLGIVLWPKWAWDATRSQKSLTILSLKSGVAAGLASIIAVITIPAPYSGLSAISIWAVVTIDILSEANVGLSLSKGVNRVAGTFSAGALAVILTQVGPDIPDSIYPYYVVFWVTFGGFVFRFLKGIPPLKDQWGYAFTVATIAFHILLLTTYLQPERVTLPLLRFSMILFGFFLWSFINLAFQPIFAGDSLHKLVAKNFDTAADVLSRCVTEYTNYRMLDHVPDILSGRSEDDKIHQAYHEIVMSDSDIDKLLGAVTWEPCHGPFFRGYPWHLYDDITDYLRDTLYDVIALDSCLRASIQAPKFLRDIFSQEMTSVAEECSSVLRTLAESMRKMSKFDSGDMLYGAEEAALALQSKISINTYLLVGRGAMESPKYPHHAASSQGFVESSWPDIVAENFRTADRDNESKSYQNGFAGSYSSDQLRQQDEEDQSKASGTVRNVGARHQGDQSDPLPIPHHQVFADHPGESIGRSLVQNNSSHGYKDIQSALSSPSAGESPSASSESLSRRPHAVSLLVDDDGKHDGPGDTRARESLPDTGLRVETRSKGLGQVGNIRVPGGTSPTMSWKRSFISRRSSIGRDQDWESTVERISALSLVKFGSLLIEIVAKMQFVVASVEELSQAARFEDRPTSQV